jgi:hypothetical protein
MRELLHRVTHRVPGVPAHTERPAGHQGSTNHGRRGADDRSNGRWNHSPARPPRFMAAWQRRIAALFGRKP